MGMAQFLALLPPSNAVKHRRLNPPPAPIAPINIVPPAVYGSQTSGTTLIVSSGSWVGSQPIVFAFQWKRNGNNIAGATSFKYVCTVADEIAALTVDVTATNIAGVKTVTAVTKFEEINLDDQDTVDLLDEENNELSGLFFIVDPNNWVDESVGDGVELTDDNDVTLIFL